MPEMKNNFLKGKMNKDLDERLVSNGEYRNALNVEVATSEGSNVGVVKNILGNHRLDALVTQGFTCVGSIANEKTNKLYWFITSYDIDAIVEYNIDNDASSFIFVDRYVGTPKSVLKFTGNIITGINIIDNLLLWTDNINDPKKINIDECKKGTVGLNHHTQLSFDKGSFNGITIDLITGDVDADGDSVAITDNSTFPFSRVKDNGERVWFERKQLDALLGVDAVPPGFALSYDDSTVLLEHKVKHYREGEYLGVKNIIVFDDPVLSTSNGTYFHAVDDFVSLTIIHDAWEEGDVIFGNDITIDIEERHITVIKLKPLSAPSIKINHSEDVGSISNTPNLFETKLPRFSYRYKYKDGEFSPFAPFTHPVFNAKYPKDTSISNDANIFYNKDNAYVIEEPHNKAMINSIHSVELTDFITSNTPEDVVEIEILYKQEESPIIYSISTIKHSHEDWHKSGNYEGKGLDIGLGKSAEATSGTYKAQGGLTKGKYTVTTENIYAALPANQLLRPWDNVPKKALAQEVTGNRIVYGNYVQNYDLGEDTEISVSYGDRKSLLNSFETQGLRHVKSQRNYQIGVIYSDKYGRETPVLTSLGGAVNIPWKSSGGNNNASRSLQLNTSVANNFPEWVDSLKFFIKETSNPYYNLIMDRAWVTKSTYELDDSKGNIWISFASSDRNKVSEEDYIILKKKIGTGEEQVAFENKFKIIDIQNNAPDAIKYQLVNYGQVDQIGIGATDDGAATSPVTTNTGTDYLTEEIFIDTAQRMDKEVDTLKMNAAGWKTFTNSGSALFGGIPIEEDVEQTAGPIKTTGLYISWRRLDADGKGVSSKKYKITGGKFDVNYSFKLATKITKIDADIAHRDGNASLSPSTVDADSNPSLHPDLIVQIEKKERKDDENFSGKFFVKISKNQVTDLIESGNPTNVLDQFQVTSKVGKCWYWQDDIPGSPSAIANAVSQDNYGLLNYSGYIADHTTAVADSIHDLANNNIGDIDATSTSTTTVELRVTDWYSPWAGIKTNFGPTFFIDSMHMAAGQSEASNYAKYSCVTWSGCTTGESTSAEDSSWSYPPLKTWLTDFEDISGLKKKLKTNSVWFNDDLISTSPLIPNQDDWRNKKVDGWVGPLQRPSRNAPTGIDAVNDNHVNGLEGIVTTNEKHTIGPRRWFSGMTTDSTESGVGSDTNIYSNDGETGRHFMHLSFFAPGKDLHPDTFDTEPTLFGSSSWAANLQGIWGGGVFTGGHKTKKFGTGSNAQKHRHIMMEGNHDSNNNYRYLSPRPGVGVGYDLKYKELHRRQWDPTFNSEGDEDNKIRDFVRNLHPGAQFRFNKVSGTTDTEVYTIKKVSVKKLYNHTSWRKAYNRYRTTVGYFGTWNIDQDYKSVEQTAVDYLTNVDASGASTNNTRRDNLKNKIKQFGAAHNRRLCYIIELDKNPTTATFNPLEATANIMTSDLASNNFCDIEFLDSVKSVLLSDLSKFPAIWELDPKKQEVDLDIYYEASNSLPIKINDRTNELFAPIGCRVEILNSTVTSSSILQSWDNSTATFYPGFPKYDIDVDGFGTNHGEIDYSDMSFKFIREDGGYTIAEVDSYVPDGVIRDHETELKFKENIGENLMAGLSWYNCFSFGNGIESNRIRDDFNSIYITNGVKASTTTQEIYEEEHKAHGLIYSGIYNSNSSVNDLNQFIMAEKTTKDLNPTFGSIQKLFQRRISLIAFCEDRVISITSNKDTIYNADGNPQLIASNMVLGDANPFSGNYGISKNPESFARESFRTYFTDKQRGAVLRLSKDGLTPLSNAGMHDWFRDNLREYNSLIGTYDSYKENYNLTLSNNSFSQNLILDSYVDAGGDPVSVPDTSNRVLNETPVGTDFQYPYELHDILEVGNFANPFSWDDFTVASYALTGSATITNHEELLAEELQTAVTQTYTGTFVAATEVLFGGGGYTGFDTNLANSGSPTPGQIISGDLEGYDFSVDGNIDTYDFSSSQIDPNIESTITTGYGSTTVYSTSTNFGYYVDSPLTNNLNGYISKQIQWSSLTGGGGINWSRLSHVGGGGDPHVMFGGFGVNGTGDLMDAYLASPNFNPSATHSSCIAGDEIHIQIKLMAYQTWKGDHWSVSSINELKARFGRNFIKPKITLYDGAVPVDSTKIANFNAPGITYANTTMGGSFTIPTAGDLALGSINADWDNDGGSRDSTISDITPYNCLHSSPFGGVDGDGGLDAYGNPLDFFDAESWQGDAYKQFSSTYEGSAPNVTSSDRFFVLSPDGLLANMPTSREFTISCSFKFINDGEPNYGTGVDPFSSAIKVVDDLKIKFTNESGFASGDWYAPANSGWNKLKNPYFKILDVKVIKGFGILADGVAEIDTFAIDTPGAAPIPPVTIPAWTELTHNYFSLPTPTWGVTTDAVGSNSFITEGNDISVFGDNRGSTIGSQVDVNSNTIEYSIPEGVAITHNGSIDGQGNITTDPADYSSTDTFAGVIGQGTSGVFAFDRGIASNNSYTGTRVDHDNSYIEIISESGNSLAATDVDHGITIEPWVVGNWYLVDVEFDETYNPNVGNGSTDGEVVVYGVASKGNFVDDEDIDIDGVGKYAGDGTNAHCKLIQTSRVEYGGVGIGVGDNKTVLRGIFKFANDSYLNENNQLDVFKLRVIGCENGIRIQKIVTKQLDLPVNWSWGSSISDWLSIQPGAFSGVHSFSDNTIYYKDNKLVWQVPGDTNGLFLQHIWSQDIATPQTIYETTWNFRFTVSEIPVYPNNFSGNVGGTIAVSDAGIFRGMAFSDIEETGEYLISFDLLQNQTTANWNVYREDLTGTVTEASPVYSNATLETAFDAGLNSAVSGNKIQFHHEIGAGVQDAQEFSISNISFIPLEQTFLGGSIGSWNISGFSNSDPDYIALDNVNNYFVFDDCPIQVDAVQFININQHIDKTINQNEQYRINFTHEITSGEVDIYYYNSEGYGFKIAGVGGATSGTPINFDQVVTIGQDIWSPGQDAPYETYNSDLQNSFVVVATDNGSLINGFIDNISMVKIYIAGIAYGNADITDKTITFNEAVNGWSSFKSFVPENGVSLSKKYFTFKEGGLWQHYVPKLQDQTGYTNNEGFFIKYIAEEADNYNIFYNDVSYSSIKGVLNQDPSTVKIFNTISYEGSQSYITQPINESEITANNAAAWALGSDMLGWKCSEIKTDLDVGSVIEFIKKEGKWFNYIKGLNAGQILDVSRFSVQGIGIVSSAQSVTFTPPVPSGNGGGVGGGY